MKGSELLGLDQGKLVNKVDEMFEAGIQMGLSREKHDVLEMRVIDVGVHSEQPLKYHLDNCLKVTREGHTQSARENLLVI